MFGSCLSVVGFLAAFLAVSASLVGIVRYKSYSDLFVISGRFQAEIGRIGPPTDVGKLHFKVVILHSVEKPRGKPARHFQKPVADETPVTALYCHPFRGRGTCRRRRRWGRPG